MAETLDTLAAKIDGLRISIDERFGQVDQRFEQVDQRFEQVDRRSDELKAELRVLIEAVDGKVGLVLEKLDDLVNRDVANSAAHARFDQRLDGHELRLLALERGNAPPTK